MKFSLASDSFQSEEIEAAIKVLKSGQYSMGAKVKEFECAFAKYTGAKHAIMVNSGSSANLLLTEALLRRTDKDFASLKAGDEVIVPALSWPTTVWPIAQLGLIPVYVDVDPKTLAIDLNKAKEALSSKTKAMFLIHVLGNACDMQSYTSFCSENNLFLVEDCCETLGAYSNNQHVGTFGYGASFSHFFSHHLTTMEGGTIITNDSQLANDLRSIRAHGWVRDRDDKQEISSRYPHFDPRFLFASTGYNVRPMEIQAAIGLVQLKRLDLFLNARRSLARKIYDLNLKYCPKLELIGSEKLSEDKAQSHSWMNIPFRVHAEISQKEVIDILERNNVDTRPIIAGNLANHPANELITSRIGSPLDVSNEIFEKGFMIGCNPDTSEESLETIEKAFKELNIFING